MRALVLCGGIPQVALLEELRRRGIYTILADRNPDVVARPYANAFFAASVLDINEIKKIAVEQRVDVILSACADQVLLVQAQLSEELGLPCYIDYKTAQNVSSKKLMKKVFVENNIPTSKYVIMDNFDEKKIQGFEYPVIVKPIDSYSSRGVRKVNNIKELKLAFETAIEISRTNTAIIEEYIEGDELSVDAYIENGSVHILCISNLDKIAGNEQFVICRTRYPAQISEIIKEQVKTTAGQIARAFNLRNSPMLIQMITDGQKLSVVEFCARTGGGDKFRLIKQVSRFDVIKAAADLALGGEPHVEPYQLNECIVNEFLYTQPCIFDHLMGFEKMQKQGVISEYFQLKAKGTVCYEARSSGDRVAYYTIQGRTMDEVREKDRQVNEAIKVIDANGRDVLRHELIGGY